MSQHQSRFCCAVFAVLVIVFPGFGETTAQAPDLLVCEGVEYRTWQYPLEWLYLSEEIERPAFRPYVGQPNTFSTGCLRGYVAVWEVRNDELYLVGISTTISGIPVGIGDLFPGSNGETLAWWYTGEIRFAVEPEDVSEISFVGEIHMVESTLRVENGIVVEIQIYPTSTSAFYESPLFSPRAFETLDELPPLDSSPVGLPVERIPLPPKDD